MIPVGLLSIIKTIEAKDLSSAKRTATREQMFRGTVLKIENENGTILSVKEDGKWTDSEL